MEPLLTVALQGTARHAGTVPETGTPVDVLLQSGEGQEPERSLLLAAGALATYLQAGQHVGASTPPLPVSPAETLPVLQGHSARLVWDLLHQRFPPVVAGDDFTTQGNRHNDIEYQAVLAEALALTARAGRRLPEHMLPKALATQNPAVREALLPVLGERGRWLAGLNPAWKWATAAPQVNDADLEATWQEGLPAQRLAALARQRALDPATARQWLATSWKSAGAEFRHDALGALETGLSLEDEPVLEAALDDRSERVRACAAQLLARLPESALAARLRERAESILTYDQAKERLVVTLPQGIDAAWQCDGVTLKPPRNAQADERLWWTVQTLALVPPSYWSTQFTRTPEKLIAAATKSELVYVMLEGWALAAIAFRDEDWSGPLWDCWRRPQGVSASGLPVPRHEVLTGLLTCMSPTQAEQRIARTLATASSKEDQVWSTVLGALRRPWSGALSRICLDYVRTEMQELNPDNATRQSRWFANLDLVAVGISSTCFSEALELTSGTQLTAVSQFMETIQVRRMLYDEFHNLRPA
jgi:hypothetical protein